MLYTGYHQKPHTIIHTLFTAVDNVSERVFDRKGQETRYEDASGKAHSNFAKAVSFLSVCVRTIYSIFCVIFCQ